MTDNQYDPFDPANLNLAQVARPKVVVVPPKLKKRREQFAKVPMLLWEHLNTAPEQTLRLVVHLIHLYWTHNGGPFNLANESVVISGIPRQSKSRALRDLESRKVVAVEWRGRKGPIVQFLSPWAALLSQ
jgi:hypothetical protein